MLHGKMPNTVREEGSRVARRRAGRRRQIVDAAWGIAREEGLAALSLRPLAAAVGMRAPSLYEYVAGKDEILDLMFAEGYEAFGEVVDALPRTGDPAADLLTGTTAFLSFCAADLARYQLMFTRAVPGWTPSAEAYAVSRVQFAAMADHLATLGITHPADVDLYTAITSGLAAQQAANDPGGDRYARLAGDAVRMFLAHVDQKGTP